MAVIPGLVLIRPLPGVVVRPLAGAAPERRISAARPRDAYHGPAVGAMLECLAVAARAVAAPAGR